MTHLSHDLTLEERDDLTRRLKAGEITDVQELRGSIFTLGDVQHAPAIPAIERYLNHEDLFVRVNAIQALAADFRLARHRASCEAIVTEQADFYLVIVALSGLGSIFEGTADKSVMRYLAGIVRDEGIDPHQRQHAYAAIQAVRGVPWPERLHRVRDEKALMAKVDWKLIESIEAIERRPRKLSPRRAARQARRASQ
jgi:hypothetical protein